MEIYEDARTVTRGDLAAWLRQLASQLESGAQIFYGAAGTVAVADQVHCELEIEREDGEISVEIEFSWPSPEPASPATRPADEDATDRDEEAGQETGGSVTPGVDPDDTAAATDTAADTDTHADVDAGAADVTGTAPAAVEAGSDRDPEPTAKG